LILSYGFLKDMEILRLIVEVMIEAFEMEVMIIGYPDRIIFRSIDIFYINLQL
jgi:hypothetical protein